MCADTATAESRVELLTRYQDVRQASVDMCRGLEPTEYRLQPCEEVSPPWWNLGHTSWFFARNVLAPFGGERSVEDVQYDYLLNSYYASLGDRLGRGRRGLMTRPTTEEVYAYRASVDRRIANVIDSIPAERFAEVAGVLRIGIEHEQQHQELFYTEIQYILAQNPPSLRRAYRSGAGKLHQDCSGPVRFVPCDGGLLEFGNVEGQWCWDNELPVHQQFLEPFALANRLVSNAEFLEFIADGGYRHQLLWLDNGWQHCQSQQWEAPLYWEHIDDQWQTFTLEGMKLLDPQRPVCHVSFYEADAFTRWKSTNSAEFKDVRLPTEREWEHAARTASHSLSDMHNVLWQWTASYYEPYPSYRPFPGALAEYNGKFMDNQRVLRGGSFATPPGHYRISYRNFWPAATRFQFTGIRLARSL
jgi:ergothioneine biosynthesis protein EgtB